MSRRTVREGAGSREFDARLEGRRLRLQVGDDEACEFEAEALRDGSWLLRSGDDVRHVHLARSGGTWWVHVDGRTHVLEELIGGAAAGPAGSLLAPMTGTVQEVLVAVGDQVTSGQALVVLSAMKMQVEMKSPVAGRVSALPHAVGDQVEGGEPVAVVEPEEAAS